MSEKPIWTPITDPARIAEITDRKWREDHPTWVRRDGVVWVLKATEEGKACEPNT